MDTLRDEACPVCGESDAYDGDECKVCGFVAPPDKFQDPDVDMHKQLDLRNNGDLDGNDVADLNAATNDRDGDGLDDNTGEPIEDENAMGADDIQPMLSCPNCGYQVEAAEPMSVSTSLPQGQPGEGSGPSEGDLCPNCGQGLLESDAQMGEMGMEDPNATDPDADQGMDPDADPDEQQQNPEDDDAPFGQHKDDDDPNADPDQEMEEDPNADPDEDDDEDDNSDPAKKKPFPPKR